MSEDYVIPQKRRTRKNKKREKKRHPYKKGGKRRIQLKNKKLK